MDHISEPLKAIQEKIQTKLAGTTDKDFRTLPNCLLCQKEVETWRESSKTCGVCAERMNAAREFNQDLIVPVKYQNADFKAVDNPEMNPSNIRPEQSVLMLGLQGCGKTWFCYAMIKALMKTDPRLKVAGYGWTKFLTEQQRGFNGGDKEPGQRMVDALMKADVALLDDIGAEKVSDSNLDWLRQNLYLIIDERCANERQTLITSNLEGKKLGDYLGPRISSRIREMCRVIVMQGRDRRLDKKGGTK